MEPSPFTRIGPGVGGAIKPDLIDIGGTLVFDSAVARLRDGRDLPSAGVVTLYHQFLDRLFTSGSGTSYAAPLVAFKAAQILARFPNASANLIRALLINAAHVPGEAYAKLRPLGKATVENLKATANPTQRRPPTLTTIELFSMPRTASLLITSPSIRFRSRSCFRMVASERSASPSPSTRRYAIPAQTMLG